MPKLIKRTAFLILAATLLFCFSPCVSAAGLTIEVGETVEYNLPSPYDKQEWLPKDLNPNPFNPVPQYGRYAGLILADNKGTGTVTLGGNIKGKVKITGVFSGYVNVQVAGTCTEEDNCPGKTPILREGTPVGWFNFRCAPFKIAVIKTDEQKQKDLNNIFNGLIAGGTGLMNAGSNGAYIGMGVGGALGFVTGGPAGAAFGGVAGGASGAAIGGLAATVGAGVALVGMAGASLTGGANPAMLFLP